jgi:hypothetical protein
MKTTMPLSMLTFTLINLASAAISQADYNLTSLYEQYAAASYCASDITGRVPQKVGCADKNANNCPLVVAANANIVTKFA